jgi:acyl-CoA synthetase (NDP forming)
MPDIRALLWPENVAVVGATDDIHKLRGRILKVMLGHDYAGKIYPVSRSLDEVQGLKAYRSIEDIGVPIDLTILIIPAEYVLQELERVGKAGGKAAVIITSGFAEQVGDEGRQMQEDLRAIAERYDLAVCGPNSEGFANMAAALCPTFSPAVDNIDVPLLPPWHEEGRIAVIAQSGAMGFSFFDRGRVRELPFRYIITSGNEATLSVFDYVDFMLDEGKTDIFILFLEDIKDAATFRRVAAKAARAGKPIIVTKIGRSDAGQRAAASHTGALAGTYAAYEAMFDHYGIIVGRDPDEIIDLVDGFIANAHRLPTGRRVGIVTGSGGAGGWMADMCIEHDLVVPELDPNARAEIDKHLPAYGTSQNPVDGTAQAIRVVGYAELARLVATANNVDGVILISSARHCATYEREYDALTSLAGTLEKPIMCFSYTLPHPTSTEIFGKVGLPLTTNLHNCARAMAAMADYRAFRERFLARDDKPATLPDGASAVKETLENAPPVISEWQARPLLAAYGIGGDDAGTLATSSDEAVAAAERFEAAVVLKIQSADIPHKSDAGGVLLNLIGGEAVRAGYDRILANAKAAVPDADIEGVLVQPMARPGQEVILGINRDEKFGPMLMIGLGGVHVEVLKDVAFAPVPLTPDDVARLIGGLKGARLLDGVRGAAPADVDALIALAVRLSQFAAEHADLIEEIDLNPVLVHDRGAGVTVVDALIVKQHA